MLEKLDHIRKRWESVEEELAKPETLKDMKRFADLSKEYKELTVIVNKSEEYRKLLAHHQEAKDLMFSEKDAELKEMAKEEFETLSEKIEAIEEEIKLLLIPKDPEDSKNAILEIRSGTGGDEASLFAGDLYRMYSRYAEHKGWNAVLVDYTEGTVGGYKEVIVEIQGQDVYGHMKYESGVHRVQRIPDTETQGRVHTSAATVAVLPEMESFEVEIDLNDVRKDLYCSSGPGGQSVNTTYSAVRLTHIPTGIVVQCQDEKSQIKNYDKAMKVLRSRIYEIEYRKKMEEISKKRKTMVSTGDRSAKIRTYNYPQGRVTEHRIGLTLYNLSTVLDGNLDEIIPALQFAENAEKMKEGLVII